MLPIISRCSLIAATSFMVCGFELSAQATSLRCSKAPVVFDFEKTEGLECLCETATEAVNLLRSMGFQTSERISFKLTDAIPSKSSHSLFGAYDPKSHEVTILEFSKAKAISASKTLAPSIELTEDLWCSFAAHELAHAIIDKSQSAMNSSRVAKEYIACVIQLLVLTPETLNSFMTAYGDVAGYKSRDEMSDTYFLLDPNRFAVKCYLHYLSLKNPQQFITELTHSNHH